MNNVRGSVLKLEMPPSNMWHQENEESRDLKNENPLLQLHSRDVVHATRHKTHLDFVFAFVSFSGALVVVSSSNDVIIEKVSFTSSKKSFT